ncbi:polyketide synthase [Streptomyces netropsis]|uniref:Polyketide biosynthesis enoyl-CoA hydratase PksI n=1 Tax=Streptomyces netropsis TaxID=55404 RepID=A0A7W7PEP6_STRNE|nr:polyketide synthase [Streptomyces netropsis]MBB4886383.1 polyketide biosynthesis enoyl-CoA hydratase PksI [Streptomyces netropsis]GGR19793.1 enoyl-CoA hydratase [Streptomyces netropsis]
MQDDPVGYSNIRDCVVQITMQDREHKNTFSGRLITGLSEAFERVRADERCKAVVLTGYDSYFASGGTKESLLQIQDRKISFTDSNIYGLALDCPVPVISAMQGHGIGGGFAMGLFSDFVVLSQESVYTTNFMQYGFTPGMGATLVLPKKLGFSLGQEMLMSAKTYYGRDLKDRGVPFPVLRRAEVLPYAVELAENLAEKPRISLITLKDHLVSDLRAELPSYIEREVAMHDKTFHQPEVRDLIQSRYAGG